jgi:FkbM family methyltransferase
MPDAFLKRRSVGAFAMKHELSKKNNIVSLVFDELAYRAIKTMHKRAIGRDEYGRPLCVSTADLIGHRLISTGIFERTQIEAVDAIVIGKAALPDRQSAQNDVFIDVGANIGFYATRYAPYFKKTIAIEASPITFDVLKGNIALSRSPNVIPICVGASDREGILPFNMHKDEMGWSSFENTASRDTFSIDVPLKTIDQIVEQHAPGASISLIKIDVEGHESKVLQGAAKTLARHKPIVLYEKLDAFDGGECVEHLRTAGYSRFVTFTRDVSLTRILSKIPVSAMAIDPNTVSQAALICAY